MKLAPVMALACLLCAPTAHSTLLHTYHIGNSLTVDANPWALDSYGAALDLHFSVGTQIRSSASLSYIWDHPEDNDFSTPPAPYGLYSNALPNYQWDALILQSHEAMSSTLGSDLSAIANFSALLRSNPLNATASVFIYAPWARQMPGMTYSELWLRPAEDSPTAPTQMSRAYFDLLAQHTGLPQIPVGEVFYRLDQRLRQRPVDGFSSADFFYRDEIHANAYGKYIALATTFAAITHRDPTGLLAPPGFGEPFVFTPQFYDLVHATIWRTINGIPEPPLPPLPDPEPAYFGDLNEDGVVNALDVSLFIAALTGELPDAPRADINQDGVVNALDIKGFVTLLLGQPSPYVVPEPASLFVALGLLLSLPHRRAR